MTLISQVIKASYDEEFSLKDQLEALEGEKFRVGCNGENLTSQRIARLRSRIAEVQLLRQKYSSLPA
jgi:hypothetical protein